MLPVNSFPRILRDESLRETVSHGSEDYAFQYYLEDVWDFDLHCIDWHWHPEVEFFFVRSGEVHLSVGGEELRVPQGCGMFINSYALHRFTAGGSTVIPNMVFSPALLAPKDSLIYREYVKPLLGGGLSCCLFNPQVSWQADVLRIMQAVFSQNEEPQPNKLRVLRLLLEMWETMAQHIAANAPAEEKNCAGHQARLQIMLQFIHDHYSEPLTLRRIADAVYISKSSALQIFRSGVQQSPITYLIDYRLKQAALLLRTTEKSVSSIALEVGFSSAGYFCRKFRALYSLTPNEYRRSSRA